MFEVQCNRAMNFQFTFDLLEPIFIQKEHLLFISIPYHRLIFLILKFLQPIELMKVKYFRQNKQNLLYLWVHFQKVLTSQSFLNSFSSLLVHWDLPWIHRVQSRLTGEYTRSWESFVGCHHIHLHSYSYTNLDFLGASKHIFLWLIPI